MSLNKSKITTAMIRAAKPGDSLVDSHGRPWLVQKNLSPEGPSYASLMLELQGFGQEKITVDPSLGIVDEEWGTIVELNAPTAHFVAKA